MQQQQQAAQHINRSVTILVCFAKAAHTPVAARTNRDSFVMQVASRVDAYISARQEPDHEK